MGSGPSDWEKGVLAASRWLSRQGKDTAHEDQNAGLSIRMLHELTPDGEGTEARVMKQIATWFRERLIAWKTPIDERTRRITLQVFAEVADAIERGDWRRS